MALFNPINLTFNLTKTQFHVANVRFLMPSARQVIFVCVPPLQDMYLEHKV